MDFLNGKISSIYFKYLSAAFGSAMVTSIYSIVDTAMVGQYHGPEGTAALAVVAPVWNIIYSLGLLMGIGGSVIFSNLRRWAYCPVVFSICLVTISLCLPVIWEFLVQDLQQLSAPVSPSL